jgi:hypothetical protein
MNIISENVFPYSDELLTTQDEIIWVEKYKV